MNPTTFSELLTDIADEYIVSAARPHRKPARWYSLSAIAACIVLLISAAIYPKLRVQKPPIVMPPAVTNETTVLSAVPPSTDQPAAQTGIPQTKAKTTAHTAISATVTVYTTGEHITQNSPPIQPDTVKQDETKPNTVTKQETVFAVVTETTAQPKQTIPITVSKTHTRRFPERPNEGEVRGDDNPPPGATETPDKQVTSPVSEELKAEIIDYFDYYTVSFYDITADAALLSGQYDGRILSLQFLRLEYDPAEGIPLIEETVELQLELPDDLKGHIEEVRADVSVTTDAAAFAEASGHEPQIIVIPRKEDDL